MKKRIRKAIRKARRGHVGAALRALVTPHHSETTIEAARARVAEHLISHHGGQVAHGPFKGMCLPEASSWGRHDVSAKILGTYERQVVDLIAAQGSTEGLMVEFGAADGYFAVGAMRAGLFGDCLCFEASEKGRAALRTNAAANGVAERIRVEGVASAQAVLREVPAGATGLLLCDIEGGEFDVLTAEVLDHLSGMLIIVELHDFLVEGGVAARAALEARAVAAFDIEVLRAADPEISAFRELDGFDDDHRLLAFSEGRDVATDWLVLRPKAPPA